MSVEDIKRWYAEQETNPNPWLLTIQLVQHAFQTGVVPTQARANTLVLIPKPEPGQVRGIGLLEPIWKLVSTIINQQLMQNITSMMTYMGSYLLERLVQHAWRPSWKHSLPSGAVDPCIKFSWTSARPTTHWTEPGQSSFYETMA